MVTTLIDTPATTAPVPGAAARDAAIADAERTRAELTALVALNADLLGGYDDYAATAATLEQRAG